MKKRKAILTACVSIICCSILAVIGIRLYNEKKEEHRMANMEVVNRTSADRKYYNSLSEMEEECTIIIEGKAGDVLGQEVTTRYDAVLEKKLPGAGYTNHEFKITKVYAGDVKVGDKIPVSQQYFVWTYEDGTEQLVSSSAVKPYKKGEKYLLFLVYNDYREAYEPICDFQSIYPVEELQMRATAKKVAQADLSYIYQVVEWDNLIPMYDEVRNKYFAK